MFTVCPKNWKRMCPMCDNILYSTLFWFETHVSFVYFEWNAGYRNVAYKMCGLPAMLTHVYYGF